MPGESPRNRIITAMLARPFIDFVWDTPSLRKGAAVCVALALLSALAEVAVAIALDQAPRQFWFHFGGIQAGPDGARRPIGAIENLITGERHGIECGGVRLYIDPARDPALLFRCLC